MNQHHVSLQHLKRKLSRGKICVKNVIPQAMVHICVIIWCQICDFSLKHGQLMNKLWVGSEPQKKSAENVKMIVPKSPQHYQKREHQKNKSFKKY